MADPLSQLRQFHMNKKEIKELNGYIIFGDHGWPKNVPTNYLMYSSGENNSTASRYYTLECLLYFLKNVDVAHQHYVRQAGAMNLPAVNRPDRKNLLAHLKGELNSPSVDRNAPIPTLRLPLSDILKKSTNQPSASHVSANRSADDSSTVIRTDEVHRMREIFAANLDESTSRRSATITATETRDHTETDGSAAITELGAENLAAMRAKRMAVKRTTIVDPDLESGLPGVARTGTQPNHGSREAELLIAMDSDPFKLIKSKEKIWRTRSTILQAQSKDFSKTVLPLVQSVAKIDEPVKRHSMPPVPDDLQMYPQHNQPTQPQAIPRNSYNRYDQERFVKLDIGVEIDTKKSFVSGVSSSLQYGNNNTSAADAQSRNVPSQQPQPQDTHQSHMHQSNINRSMPVKRPLKKVSRVPIIIIPATSTSIITMHNASPILQDLTYVDSNVNKTRESEILIQRRKPDGTHAAYKVMDNPVKLDRDDWNRVVAVFVQGPAWQFKGWPWGGSPVEIFARIKAFHLKWDESRLDDNIAKWNVQILELSRNKRHLDKASLLKFWASLDTYMTKFKTYLKF